MSKRVPKRRFKGFEGEWEEYTLEETVSFYDGQRKPIESTDRRAGIYPYYGASGIIDYIDEYIFDEELILLSEDGANIIDRNYRVSFIARGKYWVNNHAHVMKAKELFNSNFISEALERLDYTQYNTGTAQPKLNKEVCKKIVLLLPSKHEQIKNSLFLQNLDNLINLHQQKYDKLQTFKKAYLYEMFPQEGESVPKRRFAGFSGEWEKSYIENIASFSKGIGYTKNDLQPEGTPIILYGRLYTDYEFEIKNVNTFADKNDFAMISKGNEVIVPASGETAEDIARASAVNVAGCILGGDLNIIIPNSEIDSSFLALAISNGYPSKDLARRAQGKTVVHVHNSDIKEVMVSYPSINEQRKIVNYIRNLDNMIKVINVKLQKLKALKQAYLAEMFV